MKNKVKGKTQIDLQRLLFRRQFLLGPTSFTPTQYWSCVQLPHELQLSIHDDLPFTTKSQNAVTATLIGIAIDPLNPQYTEADILLSLIKKASDITTLIHATASLVGRWVIIFQNPSDTYVFTDPCGFRQVFYYSDGQQFWCGSQPEIIRANHQLSLVTDENLINFLTNPIFARRESAWVGAKTVYDKCFHLLPNHYLSVHHLEPIRFYPSTTNPIPINSMSEVIESSGLILKGIMAALTKRYDVCLAVTAGWDSRILLAASRDVCEHIEYYVYRSSIPGSNPDVWVPQGLAKKLNINFIVRSPANELPGWFVSILSQNVTGARDRPSTRFTYDKLVRGDNRINITSVGSEINRNFYDKYCKINPKEMYSADLGQIFGYEGVSFVAQELNYWRKGIINCKLPEGLNLIDMLYWEQRLGNWGAQCPAEQDIIIEELSPYNCRLLIEILSATPRHMRAAPDYPLYKELMQYLWPEVLSAPINPLKKGDFISFLWQRVDPHLPPGISMKLKRWLMT
jgi:hypothetical protein